MKRPSNICTVVIITIIFIFSCVPAVLSANTIGNNQYTSIWVSWFDLGEENYKNLGYESQAEWENEIKKQNISLQGYIRRNMKGWHVYGANAKTDVPPKESGHIIIRFKNTVFDTSRKDKSKGTINTDAEYVDASSKKVIKILEQKELSAILDWNLTWRSLSIGGRLNDAMYRIAYDIYYYMPQ